MNGLRLALVVMCATSIFAWGPGRAGVPDAELEGIALTFSDAYVAGDWTTVERYLAAGPIHAYGSDLSEYTRSRAAFKEMFDNDQKLWRGGARLGTPSEISSVVTPELATLFFHREFALGDRKLTVRFCTVWRRFHGHWKLVQSANAVPTVHQSASELLHEPTH